MKIKNLKDSRWTKDFGEHTFKKDQVCEVSDKMGAKMVELGYAVQVGGKSAVAKPAVEGDPGLPGTTEEEDKKSAEKPKGKDKKSKKGK